MTWSSRRKRVIALGACLLLAGFGLAVAVARSRGTPTPISYWLVDDRTIVVEAIAGPKASWSCAIAGTEETMTDVRVTAECLGPIFTIGSTGAGYTYDFVVPLMEPLADRRVLDAFGQPAQRCDAPHVCP